MFDGEIIRYGGAIYRRAVARECDHYLVGVDVGKQADFTALAVVKHSTRALPRGRHSAARWRKMSRLSSTWSRSNGSRCK
jgi:hypothetical protein